MDSWNPLVLLVSSVQMVLSLPMRTRALPAHSTIELMLRTYLTACLVLAVSIVRDTGTQSPQARARQAGTARRLLRVPTTRQTEATVPLDTTAL